LGPRARSEARALNFLRCYDARMKRALVVLVAVALLAGCASRPTTNVTTSPSTNGFFASPAAVANSTTETYSDAAFGFSPTYDSGFIAAPSRPISGFRRSWPGLGPVSGTFQAVAIILNGPVSQPGLLVNAWRPRHGMATPSLSQFTRRLRGDLPANVHLVGLPRATAVNGLSAIRYKVRIGATTEAQYSIWHAPFIYVIALRAPTKLWPHLASVLNAVAQTFTITH
jgi:hypothetical protein